MSVLTVLLFIFSYFLGVASAAYALYKYGIHLVNQHKKEEQEQKIAEELEAAKKPPRKKIKMISLDKHKEIIKKISKEHQLIGSFKYRMEIVSDIQKEQLDLMQQVEGPSKGAAYSRGRNSIYRYIQDLERKKLDIFKSIVEDGLDPDISIMGASGEMETIKMSEAVSISEEELERRNPSNPYKPNEKLKPKSKKTHSINSSGNLIDLNARRNHDNKESNPETD